VSDIEQDPFADMQRLLRGFPIRAVVDGGAYIGTIARRMAELFPDALVYAFEPQQSSLLQLRELSSGNSRVRPMPVALGAESGRGWLNIGQLPYTSSLLPRPQAGARYYPEDADLTGVEDVRVVALDDFAASENVTSIDVIKLDVQGYELEALRGADRLLREGVKLVYAEVSFVPLYERACLFHDLAAFLHTRGLSLYRLYDLHHADNGQLVYGDATFLHSDVRARALA
jgi:FkbM family methyltransferase